MAFDVLRRLTSCVYFLVIPDDLGTRSRVERLIEQMHALRSRVASAYNGPVRLVNCTPQNLQNTCLGVEVEDVYSVGPDPPLSFLIRYATDLRRDVGPPAVCVIYCESPIALPALLASAYLLLTAAVSSATEAAGALLALFPEWAPSLFSPSAMHSLSVLEAALQTFSLSTTLRALTSVVLRAWSGPSPHLQLWWVKDSQKEMLWSGRGEPTVLTSEKVTNKHWSLRVLYGDLCLSLYSDAPVSTACPSESAPLFSFQVNTASFQNDVWRLVPDVLGVDTDRRFSKSFMMEMKLAPLDQRNAATINVSAARTGDELVADGPATLLPDPTGAWVTHDSTPAWVDLKNFSVNISYENGTKRSLALQSITAVSQVSHTGIEFSSPLKLAVSLGAPVRCFLALGRELWIGCADGKLAVVHLDGKQVLAEIDGTHALSSLGGCVWSASADGSLAIWIPGSPHALKRRCTDLAPAGIAALIVVSGTMWALDSAGYVSLWSCEGNTLRKFKLPAPGICAARTGELVWIAVDTMLYAFDAKTAKMESFFKAHDSSISSIVGSDGKLWSASATDRTLKAWNIKTYECTRIIPGDFEAPLVSIERCLWSISSSQLQIWENDTADLAHLMTIAGPRWQVVYEIRKGLVACAAADRSVTLFTLSNPGATLSLYTVSTETPVLTMRGSARQPLARWSCQLRAILPSQFSSSPRAPSASAPQTPVPTMPDIQLYPSPFVTTLSTKSSRSSSVTSSTPFLPPPAKT